MFFFVGVCCSSSTAWQASSNASLCANDITFHMDSQLPLLSAKYNVLHRGFNGRCVKHLMYYVVT